MHLLRLHHPYTSGSAAILSLVLVLLPAAGVPAQEAASGQTLREQLEATNAGFAAQMPADVIRTIDDAVRQVADSGVLDEVIGVGDTAPDFELPDATGHQVRLSTLLREGPVVLTWYRGNW